MEADPDDYELNGVCTCTDGNVLCEACTAFLDEHGEALERAEEKDRAAADN